MFTKGSASNLITVSEWLGVNGHEYSHSKTVSLAMLAAKIYLREYGYKPRRINRKGSNNRFTKRSYGYTSSEMFCIEQAWYLIHLPVNDTP